MNIEHNLARPTDLIKPFIGALGEADILPGTEIEKYLKAIDQTMAQVGKAIYEEISNERDRKQTWAVLSGSLVDLVDPRVYANIKKNLANAKPTDDCVLDKKALETVGHGEIDCDILLQSNFKDKVTQADELDLNNIRNFFNAGQLELGDGITCVCKEIEQLPTDQNSPEITIARLQIKLIHDDKTFFHIDVTKPSKGDPLGKHNRRDYTGGWSEITQIPIIFTEDGMVLDNNKRLNPKATSKPIRLRIKEKKAAKLEIAMREARKIMMRIASSENALEWLNTQSSQELTRRIRHNEMLLTHKDMSTIRSLKIDEFKDASVYRQQIFLQELMIMATINPWVTLNLIISANLVDLVLDLYGKNRSQLDYTKIKQFLKIEQGRKLYHQDSSNLQGWQMIKELLLTPRTTEER